MDHARRQTGAAAVPARVRPDELSILARKINDAHDAAEETAADAKGAVQHALEYAAEAGKLLAEAKEKVGHGGWLDWLRENFKGSERTAQNYLKIHKSLPALIPNPQRVADLSMREAMKLLQHMEADEPDRPTQPAADPNAGRFADPSEDPAATPPTASGNGHAPLAASNLSGDGSPFQQSAPVAAPAAPPAPLDRVGQPIPERIREAFAAAPLFKESLNLFDQIAARMNKVLEGDARHHVNRQKYELDFYNAREAVKFGAPYAVCPYCNGSGKSHSCYAAPGREATGGATCRGLGWMTQEQYERVPPELRQKAQAPPRGAAA